MISSVSNNTSPKVTILMTVFNGEKYLSEAIESILTQSYTNFEFLIINDGSEDLSEKIILNYNDNRIRYIKNEKNIGLIKTLNNGIALSNGKYIARMDADDVSEKNRINNQVEFLEKNKEYGLVGTWCKIIGNSHLKEIRYPINHDTLKFEFVFHNVFVHSSIMIRKQVLIDNALLFSENYTHAEDYKLWTEMVHKCKIYNIPEFLVRYRIHENQISVKYLETQKALTEKIRKEYIYSGGFGDDEIQILKQEENVKKNIDKNDAARFLNILENFQKKNNQTFFFSNKVIFPFILDYWKNTFLELKDPNFKLLRVFFYSELSKLCNWNFKQKLSILKKFLLSSGNIT